ncbi:hypothetical protein [Thiothrix subterranea]|uniref:Uncharacterized protein n=1 Tax=Thiothrix subterranea TaxID=2735563 RepID=A0AA51MQ66_9GAMM|nr:hypothetical protein [Thiothrix subterranea]MDQ5770831.1 hypothetical protein [Thiothrix subterranea]WML87251.1 hypothetical protein RCG00_02570 [Thiothrix subterranea]
MTAATKHLHKRVLNLEIGDDEDPIFPAPNAPELAELHQQFMDSLGNEGDLMRRRGEFIREWAEAHEKGDDLADIERRWSSVEAEISQNRASLEECGNRSATMLSESLTKQRRELTAAKAARMHGL